MFGGALIAIGTLLQHIGGFGALVEHVPSMKTAEGYFVTGFESDKVVKYMEEAKVTTMTAWQYVKLIFVSDYTLFSALIGATIGNMAAFGTDQDMVQRMLTAETHKKARKSLITAAFMDLPIAAAFTFIGILLYVFYQQNPSLMPSDKADVFGAYIINVMPVGIRGLVLAGVFATAMGSLSAALNALATSATNDWYLHHRKGKSEEHYVSAARWFTVIFAGLMIVIAGAFAYAKVVNPEIRIIPVVLGIAGFILGPMLGVFLIGMLTKDRGSDKGNIIAVTCGLFVTTFLGNLIFPIVNFFFKTNMDLPAWLPKISFTWYAMIGALVVFVIGVCFKTPQKALDEAVKRAAQAESGEDIPIALREATS